MDRRTFVAVFAGVGAAIGVALLAVGIVSVATGARWGWLLPGVATLALVGAVVLAVRRFSPVGR